MCKWGKPIIKRLTYQYVSFGHGSWVTDDRTFDMSEGVSWPLSREKLLMARSLCREKSLFRGAGGKPLSASSKCRDVSLDYKAGETWYR